MSFFRGLWKSSSKHKKLCEEWALASSRECVEGGVSSSGGTQEESEDASEARFTLKYLGSTLVETPSSEEATAEAIKTVITMAKASGKKLQRVSLAVSLKGIRMTDLATEEDQLQVSIYRKMAQTVTLTVAQAFNTAYEAWQLSQADPRIHHAQDKSPPLTDDRNGDNEKKKKKKKEEEGKSSGKEKEQTGDNVKRYTGNDVQKNLLIDLSNEAKPAGNSWVCFEEEDGKKAQRKSSATNIPMTTLRHGATSTSHHVVPRPTTGFKIQNAWGESRSFDLMCS
ncbi:uncharacterized protein LOC100883753 isoform X3 [Megachile rotundata]|uniref:uncharacterized protein LOC100883753 isoform X3 n=1 Tax=Megachile rotundata TaxID=143995 RepID=UPI000614D2D8|nr:PREDICTED: low density lipoprotein receptor adapter protein 1-like isoform X3 [Megachile rotundata]